MPRDFLKNSKLREFKGLIKISANWSSIRISANWGSLGTNFREKHFFSTKSLMKW